MNREVHAVTSVQSKHGNCCATCQHRHHPQGGHCYMFKVEPSFCAQWSPDRKQFDGRKRDGK